MASTSVASRSLVHHGKRGNPLHGWEGEKERGVRGVGHFSGLVAWSSQSEKESRDQRSGMGRRI